MASNTSDDTPFRLSQSEYWLQLHTELSNSKSLNSDEIECVLSTIEEVLSSVDFQSNPILDSIILVSVMCFEIITKDEALHSDSSLQKYLYRIVVPLSKTTENAGYLVAEKFLCQALKLVSNDVVNLDVRLEILTVFNVIISNLTTTSRIHVWKSTELRASICNFGANLVNFGDFDLQAHAIALLLRLVPHAYRKRFASLHITGEQVELSAHFSRIDESSFELGIRNFLNSLNMSIIEDPKIVSLPCSSAFLCDTQVRVAYSD
ncbi:unnamed protein product [Dicrocoelium dendriticum]|nr:unnamed protein product [Dicrocoelium dendriticum]